MPSVNYTGSPTSLGTKDVDATLDYMVDWGPYLFAHGYDTIVSSSWISHDGIEIAQSPAPIHTDTTTTVWLTGGGEASSRNRITNRIVTAGGRTEDRSFLLTTDEL